MRIRTPASASACVLGILFLAGCSAEPSSAEIESAIKKNTDDANRAALEMATAFAGAKAVEKMKDSIPQLKLNSAKKVGCKEDGKDAYKCDVEYDAEQPMIGRIQKMVSMRFVKGSNGWVLAN